MNVIMAFLYEALRKFFFWAGMDWLIEILKQVGASPEDIEKWVKLTSAIIIVGGMLLWTRFIKPWVVKQFPGLGPILDKGV